MRKILLIEPGYRNKYPPMGLMKLSTYHKMLGDDVRFFKGSLKEFIIDEISNELIGKLYYMYENIEWINFENEIKKYVLVGHKKSKEYIINNTNVYINDLLDKYRKEYKNGTYIENNKWDRICITTLFTFYYNKSVETINDFKILCKDEREVFIGGILSSVLPEEIEKATGIKPYVGLLDKENPLDDNDIIIDNLLLDYSILDDTDYVYAENSGYYGYMTRGCINKCKFCLVPELEPNYDSYKSLKEQIKKSKDTYGDRRNLLLLDNNVLASDKFNQIIDDIIELGFDKNAKYIESNKYEYYLDNINNNINLRVNLKGLYKFLNNHVNELKNEEKNLYKEKLYKYKLNNKYIFDKEKILDSKKEMREYFEKKYKYKRPKQRYVDFNQGLEANLLTEEKVKKISEIPIRPLRIAFDNWSLRDKYENAIRLSAKYDIKSMSNYILYNYTDKPEELYYRLKLNIDLCEELNINIYSFPMKYHPIKDEEYFSNRNFIGKHWNKKFIRAIQAILNSTKGKVGKGKSFFEEAFGKDVDEYFKILYMPETFIIYRKHCRDLGLTEEWYELFISLSEKEKEIVIPIIEANKFDINIELNDKLNKLISFYKIKREDIEHNK